MQTTADSCLLDRLKALELQLQKCIDATDQLTRHARYRNSDYKQCSAELGALLRDWEASGHLLVANLKAANANMAGDKGPRYAREEICAAIAVLEAVARLQIVEG